MRDYSGWPKGKTRPRIETAPLRELTPETSLGFLCIQFAQQVLGIQLAPWQEYAVQRIFELRPDGRLRFRNVVIGVARQNGKTLLLKVLGLFYMLVLAPGETVLSAAQDLETAEDVHDEALDLVKEIPGLRRRLLGRPSMKSGQRRFRLDNGSRWLAKASNRKAGRGKSNALVLFDELREQLDRESWAALSSTILTREKGMVVGFSNAGDAKSILLRGLRTSAIEQLEDPNTQLLLLEWSAPEDADLDDPEAIAQANPGLGYVHEWSRLLAERGSSTDVDWQTENLCRWVTALKPGPWATGVWEDLTDTESAVSPDSPVVLSVDLPMDYAEASIMLAGYTRPGRTHVERIAHRPGDAWVIRWLVERWDAIGAQYVVIQGRGAPASGLAQDLTEAGIPVARCQGADVTASFKAFYQAVQAGKIVHLAQPSLDAAALQAAMKTTGDGLQMWDRAKSRPVDIAPLIGATQAAYGLWNEMPVEGEAERTSAYEDHDVMFV